MERKRRAVYPTPPSLRELRAEARESRRNISEEEEEKGVGTEETKMDTETPSTPRASPGGGTPTTPGVKMPRVGGIIGGYPWTGGSAINRRSRPLSSMTYRPAEFKHAFSIEQAATKGLPESKHLCKEERTSKVTLTLWIDAIRVYMEEHGMNSVFRLFPGDALSAQGEVYLLEDWGGTPKEN